METPLFSIIVPVYKTEAFLRQCVDSILNQTYPDFQLILVDDGSPDGSGAICDTYAGSDSRVTVIHKENGGPGKARKAALERCCGEYIVCVDSDDCIAPDHLERFAAEIEAHRPDVVLFSATRFSERGQTPVPTLLPAGCYRDETLKVIQENLICAGNMQQKIMYGVCLAAIKRKLYAKYQMMAPESIRHGEDMAITVPALAESASVCVLDYCSYFYRDNPASITNTFQHSEVREMKELAAYLRSTLDAAYYQKIDLYVASHYFDFLDRAMLRMNYREYGLLVRQTLDEELYGYLARAKCRNNTMWQIVMLLMRRKLFGALWILRKIRKRKE